MASSSDSASTTGHIRISGSIGSGWLYRNAEPSSRDAWNPAASATAAGAAESHSYCPPAWMYASASPSMTAAAFAPAEPSGTSVTLISSPSRSRKAGGLVRLTTTRSGSARFAGGRHHGRRGRRQHLALGGERHRARGQRAALPERDVDRPVGAPGLAELPGAIQWVHDPHPVGGQPRRVVLALLGQHRVTGPARGQLGGEELVRKPVSRFAQVARIAPLGAQVEQQLAGLFRELSGKTVVIKRHQAGSLTMATRGGNAWLGYRP